MIRTSISDPLQIAELPCGGGILGLTFCPGKIGPSVFGGPWKRDLDADLLAIKDWGASTVVTLMEEHELRGLMVDHLGRSIENLGIIWISLPIVDVDIPDEAFERRWTYYGHLLRARLRNGERIVIHCRGGRGRTGLVAAKLLTEFGMKPKEAVQKVRLARPGAIETHSQEAYVLSSHSVRHDESNADKVLGCLLGGAVGDGFGYAIEFDRLDAIRIRFGQNGLQEPVFSKGRLVVSDDTQMTLFTAEGLARELAKDDDATDAVIIEAIRLAYLDWLRTQTASFDGKARSGISRYRELWERRAPGTNCQRALRAGGNGSPERPLNNSKGCGGVMRVAPLALCPKFSAERALVLAARAAALTHGHPSGYLSAGALASLLSDLVGGLDLNTSIENVRRRLANWAGHEETLAAVDLAVRFALEKPGDLSAVRQLGEGWVGEEALAIALYAAMVADSFQDAIQLAANHDGDSDSTASIAGQIWGAANGVGDLPADWVSKLDVLEPILEQAQILIGHAHAGGTDR